MVSWRISYTKMDCPCNNSDLVMDIKQKRPYTLEEEKILREGLSDINVTYEDVAEVEIETPFVDSKIQDIEYDKWLEAKNNKTDLNKVKRDTTNDPFKGTSIEGKD